MDILEVNRLIHDKAIVLTTANSCQSTSWKNEQTSLLEFVKKLSAPVITGETAKEFEEMSKSRQNEIKNVGGYVPGSYSGEQRRKEQLLTRNCLTLDADNIPPDKIEEILNAISNCGAITIVHSTHKHCHERPRLRIIIPLSEDIPLEQYAPITRKVAEILGILPYLDPKSFDANQMMFWPSVSKGAEYIFRVFDGKDKSFLNGKEVLAMYKDWEDSRQWPTSPNEGNVRTSEIKKLQDPASKPGFIGLFCKAFSIDEAIERFLPDKYESVGNNRYTYLNGSTAAGAIVYDEGKYLYSHHATDPCCDKLVNSFDLVRYHLFGKEDDEAKPDTPVNQLPSYKSMCEFAKKQPEVMDLINKRGNDTFPNLEDDSDNSDTNNDGWKKLLTYKKNSSLIENKLSNIELILSNDPNLKGKIANDTFRNRMTVRGKLPWKEKDALPGECFTDTDESNLLLYFEENYGNITRSNLEDGLRIVATKVQYNSVKVYLDSLKWDGVKRVSDLLTNYLGAEDNIYTQEAIYICLLNAIRRAISDDPRGVKADYVLVLVGPQGIGKSKFVRALGMEWFSDSLESLDGSKDSYEALSGKWIIELGEMSAYSRQDINNAKKYLTKLVDHFRDPYGHFSYDHIRRCVFIGTSNDDEFLKDETGNRRFWPVDLNEANIKCSISELADDPQHKLVDQIWAEVYNGYKNGDSRYQLSQKAEKIAKEQQLAHKQTHPWTNIIADYLEKLVPTNWKDLSADERKAFMDGEPTGNQDLVPINEISKPEIWCEILDQPKEKMTKSDSTTIKNIMLNLPGWRPGHVRTKHYGDQSKGFVRDPKK